MRARNVNYPDTLQAMEVLRKEGYTIAEIAEKLGIKPATLYTIRSKMGITKLQRQASIDHVALQLQSGTPPEVYCFRAGIKIQSLRTYASNKEQRLAIASIVERQQWWRKQLHQHGVTRRNVATMCRMNRWPLLHAVKQLHAVDKPKGTWLYDMEIPHLIMLPSCALDSVASTQLTSHVVANGNKAVCVDENTLNYIIRNEGIAK